MDQFNKNMEKPSPRNGTRRAVHITSLSVTTITFALVLVVNALSTGAFIDPKKVGFKNGTGNISDEFYTVITPAGWTFAIWSVIYIFQFLWLGYSWTFTCRPSATHTVTPTTFFIYNITNICNIVWLYLWGNELVQYSFPVLVLTALSLYTAVGIELVYLNRIPTPSTHVKEFKIDYYLSQVLVGNGLAIYATWTTIATLINLDIVLQYTGGYDATNVGTIALSVLTVELLVYFILENTILDKFLRFVFVVYPVVIWALSGVVSAHGVNDSNGIFTLTLLVVASILFLARIALWVVFALFRPIRSTSLFRYRRLA